MTWKFSAEPTPRPPDTTRAALCRSGRSDLPAARPAKRVCVGRATSSARARTAALPPCPAAGQEATRTVATTGLSAGVPTVTMAFPA